MCRNTLFSEFSCVLASVPDSPLPPHPSVLLKSTYLPALSSGITSSRKPLHPPLPPYMKLIASPLPLFNIQIIHILTKVSACPLYVFLDANCSIGQLTECVCVCYEMWDKWQSSPFKNFVFLTQSKSPSIMMSPWQQPVSMKLKPKLPSPSKEPLWSFHQLHITKVGRFQKDLL
jgi:hypothetical protein